MHLCFFLLKKKRLFLLYISFFLMMGIRRNKNLCTIKLSPQQSEFWVCSVSLKEWFFITSFVLIGICRVPLQYPGRVRYWSIWVCISVSFAGTLSASASTLNGIVCPMDFTSVHQYLIFLKNMYFLYSYVYKTTLLAKTFFFRNSPQQFSSINKPVFTRLVCHFPAESFHFWWADSLNVSGSHFVYTLCSSQRQLPITKWNPVRTSIERCATHEITGKNKDY